MIIVSFNKQFAEAALRSLEAGRPIPVPPGGWSRDHVTTLMGVAYGVVFSDRVRAGRMDDLGRGPMRNRRLVDLEKDEAPAAKLHDDLHNAAIFISLLSGRVRQGSYDMQFADVIEVGLHRKANDAFGFVIFSGEKDTSDLDSDSEGWEGEQWKKGATG